MTVKNFRSIVWTVFENIEKVQKLPFFGHFVLILAMFPRYQQYDFDVIVNIGPQYGVEGL